MWCPAAGHHESELTQLSEVTTDEPTQLSEVTPDSKTPAKDTLLVRQGEYVFSIVTDQTSNSI